MKNKNMESRPPLSSLRNGLFIALKYGSVASTSALATYYTITHSLVGEEDLAKRERALKIDNKILEDSKVSNKRWEAYLLQQQNDMNPERARLANKQREIETKLSVLLAHEKHLEDEKRRLADWWARLEPEHKFEREVLPPLSSSSHRDDADDDS